MGTINDEHSKKGKENEPWTIVEVDSRSLKNCLRMFGFVHVLKDLDINLEAIRQHKVSDDTHKKMIKDLDKKLSKLSLKHHPDRFNGTADKTEVHDNQASINAIRLLLSGLSEEFLRDIDIDYRYEYYTYINIRSIENEEDVDKLNLALQYYLIKLSEIKHEKIIANIKKFLTQCEECLDFYNNANRTSYTSNFNLAVNRLKECILGFQALTKEFRNVEKQCVKDHQLQNIIWTVIRVSDDFEKQLKILEKIKDVANQSLKGKFQFYAENETMDDYLVLPFAKYINVLSMCNVMLGNTKRGWFDKKNDENNLYFCQLDGNSAERNYYKAYSLASYFENPNRSNRKVFSSHKFCKLNFDSILQNIRKELRNDFHGEKNYIVSKVKRNTEGLNRDDFIEAMLKRKKSNILQLNAYQEKIIIDKQGNAMPLSEIIQCRTDHSKLDARKGASDKCFHAEKEEEKLIVEITDIFKEMGEKWKRKVLQSDLINEKLKEDLDDNKNKEIALFKKLLNFNSKNTQKFVDEILKLEEENDTLRKEIEKKRKEERFLILTLCEKYEKFCSFFQEKINEIENKIPTEELREEITGIDYSRMSKKYRTTSKEVENDVLYTANLKFNFRTAFQIPETEENTSEVRENERVNQKTCFDILLDELNSHLDDFPSSVKNYAISKNVQINIQNKDLVQNSLKVNNSNEVPRDEIFEPISFLTNNTESNVTQLPEINEFDAPSSQFKILNNATENQTDVDQFKTQVKQWDNPENVAKQELLKECTDLKSRMKEVQSQKCTANFCENYKPKEVSTDESPKRKSLTNLKKEDIEFKRCGKYSANKSFQNHSKKDKATEIDTEHFRSYEREHEKDRVVIEALRNLKKSCKLKYENDLGNSVIPKK